MMISFGLLSILVTVGALFSLISYRVLRLPTTIGTMILALVAAVVLIATGQREPALHAAAEQLVSGINFNHVVLHGMLAFLLFAGALQLDISALRRQWIPVLVLSVAATALSVVFVAFPFRWALHLLGVGGVEISMVGALLFGALISPTDPIAVLDMLRRTGSAPELEVQLAGESLFNDGVGAVIFLAMLGASAGGSAPSPARFGVLLLLQAGGGIGLGLLLGYVAYRLLLHVDSYRVEVLLTLALAMGGYALADRLALSAPLEVVAAGLVVNGRARRVAMSEETCAHVELFWELVDDVLNIVLFLLLGLQILIVPFTRDFLFAGLLAIPLVLLARVTSVGLTAGVLGLCRERASGSVLVLTWGGLRGGLAVALALSLPGGHPAEHNLLLVATFVVVIFSIVIQGLTLPPLLRAVARKSVATAGR